MLFGVIVGMGEQTDDLIQVAKALRELEVASLPVNFFLPISGTQLTDTPECTLNPDYCLRVLCLYRFLNPRAEIRVAAGREHHLRSMEVMALYPANSMFIEGYLNATGTDASRTLQMIKDAGICGGNRHRRRRTPETGRDSEKRCPAQGTESTPTADGTECIGL